MMAAAFDSNEMSDIETNRNNFKYFIRALNYTPIWFSDIDDSIPFDVPREAIICGNYCLRITVAVSLLVLTLIYSMFAVIYVVGIR